MTNKNQGKPTRTNAKRNQISVYKSLKTLTRQNHLSINERKTSARCVSIFRQRIRLKWIIRYSPWQRQNRTELIKFYFFLFFFFHYSQLNFPTTPFWRQYFPTDKNRRFSGNRARRNEIIQRAEREHGENRDFSTDNRSLLIVAENPSTSRGDINVAFSSASDIGSRRAVTASKLREFPRSTIPSHSDWPYKPFDRKNTFHQPNLHRRRITSTILRPVEFLN